MKSSISILLLSAAVALAESPETIQRVPLDERVVVTVPVATNRVTTISFPGPIAAIDAVGVTADGKTPGQFQLAHTKGSTFLSVRALARKAATAFEPVLSSSFATMALPNLFSAARRDGSSSRSACSGWKSSAISRPPW